MENLNEHKRLGSEILPPEESRPEHSDGINRKPGDLSRDFNQGQGANASLGPEQQSNSHQETTAIIPGNQASPKRTKPIEQIGQTDEQHTKILAQMLSGGDFPADEITQQLYPDNQQAGSN